MVDIKQLMLDASDDGSDEYKEGWNSAIGYLNDNYCITTRNGEPISIVLNTEIDDETLIEKIAKVLKCKK